MPTYVRRLALALLVVLLLPAAAYAQAAITGVVKDASGAVLPGVTVEAASSVLIEKTRSVVTDDTGQFRIVDLRPGTYTVTFTLQGFSTVRREGIELTGDFVATVNGDLRVGNLEETITVTGESPIVDVQSARVQSVVDRDVLTAIPSSRNANGIQALVAGMSSNGDAGGITGGSGGMAGNIHGARASDSRTLHDGINTGWAGANSNAAVSNVAGSQEIVMTTSDRKSTRLNSSHSQISYAVFCLKKKIPIRTIPTKKSRRCRNGSRASSAPTFRCTSPRSIPTGR